MCGASVYPSSGTDPGGNRTPLNVVDEAIRRGSEFQRIMLLGRSYFNCICISARSMGCSGVCHLR